jgi:hypothetical protein
MGDIVSNALQKRPFHAHFEARKEEIKYVSR